jgi:hypothetical protein
MLISVLRRIIVCTAFNHWRTGSTNSTLSDSELVTAAVDEDSFPTYVLAIHSSRAVLVEQISMPEFCLSDFILDLVIKNGKKHEVSSYATASETKLQIKAVHCTGPVRY